MFDNKTKLIYFFIKTTKIQADQRASPEILINKKSYFLKN